MVNELKINAEIKARTVRLIDQDGNMVGEVSIGKALEYAREVDLDLVEISPNASRELRGSTKPSDRLPLNLMAPMFLLIGSINPPILLIFHVHFNIII